MKMPPAVICFYGWQWIKLEKIKWANFSSFDAMSSKKRNKQTSKKTIKNKKQNKKTKQHQQQKNKTKSVMVNSPRLDFLLSL